MHPPIDLVEAAFERERPRIVGLCAHIIGNRLVAEDLAQETFVEAWRHIDRLDDPSGMDRWLSAIARNVCKRWRALRVQEGKRILPGRDTTISDEDMIERPDSSNRVEFDLERAELANLLDHALGQLSDATRQALLARYIADSPYAEIADRLGLSEGAVKMRVKRGRVALRMVLSDEFHATHSDVLSLPDDSNSRWMTTTLWCSTCGDLALRCSTCYPTLGIHESQTYGLPEVFDSAETVEEAYAHLINRAGDYLWESLLRDHAQCVRCGAIARVESQVPNTVPLRTFDWRGVQIYCEACGHTSWGSLNGLLMSLPELQRFRNEHPRIRTMPEQRVESGGQPAVVIRFASRTANQQVTAVVARNSLQLLKLYSGFS